MSVVLAEVDEVGLHAFNIARVVERAGVAVHTIYYRFADRTHSSNTHWRTSKARSVPT